MTTTRRFGLAFFAYEIKSRNSFLVEILQALIDFRRSLHDPNAIQEISSVAQGKTAGKEFQFGQHGRSRAQGVYPESKQQGQKMRIPRNFSANRDLDSVFLPYFKNSPQKSE